MTVMQGINVDQLRTMVVRPACRLLNALSDAAEELVMGTALIESDSLRTIWSADGRYGPWQMDGGVHDDLWASFLAHDATRRDAILEHFNTERRIFGVRVAIGHPPAETMCWDLRYAAAMARVYYLRVREPLPPAGELNAQARYWKRYYAREDTPLTIKRYVQLAEAVLVKSSRRLAADSAG